MLTASGANVGWRERVTPARQRLYTPCYFEFTSSYRKLSALIKDEINLRDHKNKGIEIVACLSQDDSNVWGEGIGTVGRPPTICWHGLHNFIIITALS